MSLPDIIEPHTDAWFQARVGKWTASRTPTMMDRTKKGEPTAKAKELPPQVAYERLSGIPYEVFQTYAMKRGQELEPHAIAAYQFATMNDVTGGGYVAHPECPWIGATPDGFIGEDGLLEIKCPSSGVKQLGYLTSDALVEEYGAQVQHQLMVTGREWCDLVAYDERLPVEMQLAIVRVERDAEMIEDIMACLTRAEAEVTAILSQVQGRAAA